MRAPTGTLLRGCVVIVVGLGLLTGCSEKEEPGTLPAKSPNPSSSSASPTPATPEQEVEATMVAYFDAANDMFETGDFESLRAFSTQGCPCRQITESVERVVQAGGHYEGARYVVRSIKVHEVDGGTALAEVKADVPPYKVFDGEGKVSEKSGGGTLHTDFSMIRRGSRWVVGNALNLG